MSGVIAEGQRLSIFLSKPTMCAQYEEGISIHFRGIPSHAGILGQAKEVATGFVQEHLLSQRQFSGRTGCP